MSNTTISTSTVIGRCKTQVNGVTLTSSPILSDNTIDAALDHARATFEVYEAIKGNKGKVTTVWALYTNDGLVDVESAEAVFADQMPKVSVTVVRGRLAGHTLAVVGTYGKQSVITTRADVYRRSLDRRSQRALACSDAGVTWEWLRECMTVPEAEAFLGLQDDGSVAK